MKPRYIIEDKCTGCGVCVEYCPVEYPDQYNQEISSNKAVHIYFAQAIPLITYIDQSCLYLKEKKCRICEGVCKNNAINLHQLPEKRELNVAAIVLSPGYDVFDPKVRDEYGYGRLQNVVTGMDYERLLCATGPYEGEILRASDLRHPRNVAWIQCVGSRRVSAGDNSYCSAVCCTYAQKQVILTKDHNSAAACTIFHNDVRSYGKGFETFYQRTQNLADVRFMLQPEYQECAETEGDKSADGCRHCLQGYAHVRLQRNILPRGFSPGRALHSLDAGRSACGESG